MGLLRKPSSVSDAALLLGFTRIKAVSLGIAAMSGFEKRPGTNQSSPPDLWLHSLSIAIAMQTLANAMPRTIRPTQDQIFLAGLLHDMGYIALHYIAPEASDRLHHQFLLEPKRPSLEIELQMLGITHCEIGAQLARQWNLPEDIITVLGNHHVPNLDTVADDHLLPRLVNMAEKLLPNFGITEYCDTTITDQDWQALGIDPENADDLIATINELAIQTAQSTNS